MHIFTDNPALSPTYKTKRNKQILSLRRVPNNNYKNQRLTIDNNVQTLGIPKKIPK